MKPKHVHHPLWLLLFWSGDVFIFSQCDKTGSGLLAPNVAFFPMRDRERMHQTLWEYLSTAAVCTWVGVIFRFKSAGWLLEALCDRLSVAALGPRVPNLAMTANQQPAVVWPYKNVVLLKVGNQVTLHNIFNFHESGNRNYIISVSKNKFLHLLPFKPSKPTS